MSNSNPFEDISKRLENIESLLTEHFLQQLQKPREMPLMNIDEAASYLKTPKKTIYHFTSSGNLKYYKPGRRLLFKKEDLDSFLNASN